MIDIKKHDIYEKFANNGGLLQPIRTKIVAMRDCLHCTFNKIAEAVSNGETDAIIGYFAADKTFDIKNPLKTIGVSIIHPDDFNVNIDKNVSKLKAISMAHNKDKIITPSIINDEIVRVSGNSTTLYVFANGTIRDQFFAFVKRCDRYFNNDGKNAGKANK